MTPSAPASPASDPLDRQSASAAVAVPPVLDPNVPDDSGLPIPEGFVRVNRGISWFSQLGPVYAKPGADGTTILALRLGQRHANLRGNAHGGMLMTLADGALGANVSQARGIRGGQVTVSLNADFLSGVKQGDWLEAHVSVRKLGRTLVFADCILKVGERDVFRSNATFALVDPPAHITASSSIIEPAPGD